jgi:thymidylate synthase
MNKLDKQYQDLLQSILDYGVEKQDRTGTGTKSIFGYTIRHNMSEGFPLLTTKKMAWKTMVTELLWFLRGDTNIKFLVDNNCHIWDGDAYKNYLKHNDEVDNYWIKKNPEIKSRWKPYSQEEFINKIKTDDEFAKKWGELGPVYGAQWRSWHSNAKVTMDGKYHEEKGIDQIQNLINDLKTNPDSRRLMVTAWNPADLEASVLPPCHYGFQVYTRELSEKERIILAGYDYENRGGIGWNMLKETVDMDNSIPRRAISLIYNARSQDVPLGTPFNLASYGLLLMILAKEVNMVPDELITNMGDCHIYLNQIDGVKEQLTREPFELPTLSMDYREGEYDKELKGFVPDDFVLFNYQSHPSIKIPLSN